MTMGIMMTLMGVTQCVRSKRGGPAGQLGVRLSVGI